ncbi:adhesion G protein-coupled receptor G3 [Clupea harengus]|uniref:Adhesion G protein-coupled receptor G3 n=1 Tax=Clupea harengus TaxID=7950 RepID=A0A8M1KS52_CLUHA|nr:adhesion G protein-coupled receptor G3 [Clupea harengus]
MAFCLIRSPMNFEDFGVLDGRLYGISVCDKNISGLNQRINITVNLNISDDTKEPSCVFLDFSNKNFSQEGCSTEWIKENATVVCSCNHLTYFAVLMVSPNITKDHAVNLTYISVIGCSISLAFLLLTVFLFLIQR